MANWKLKAKIIGKYGVLWKFAKDMGIDAAIVSKVIHEHFDLKDADKQRWAKVLECEVKDLF